ncbi:MAG: class IIb bacteriocin, lactobin A/cerein 7B family [Microcoleaceae cyanobacterium MO_207.B10]|nr:class IIb bacteriocin, lactobin A/cerein 7B family [Microcoleaceae cyanobacterium MO_207.B10]
MTTIQIQDLEPQGFVLELNEEELEEIQGGCLPCLLVVGAVVGYILN